MSALPAFQESYVAPAKSLNLSQAHAALLEGLAEAPLAAATTAVIEWRQRAFQIDFEPRATGGIVHVQACLGLIPFNAESAELRRHLIDRIRADPAFKFQSLSLDRRGRLWFTSQTLLDEPCPISRLVSVCTVVVLAHDRLFAELLPFLAAPVASE